MHVGRQKTDQRLFALHTIQYSATLGVRCLAVTVRHPNFFLKKHD